MNLFCNIRLTGSAGHLKNTKFGPFPYENYGLFTAVGVKSISEEKTFPEMHLQLSCFKMSKESVEICVMIEYL
jgi:hypothetical protein